MSLYQRIFESDEHIRRLERIAATGDPGARARLKRAKERTESPEQKWRKNVLPAVERFRELHRHPEAHLSHTEHYGRAYWAAEKVKELHYEHGGGRPSKLNPGHLLTRRKDQGPEDHVRELVRLTGGSSAIERRGLYGHTHVARFGPGAVMGAKHLAGSLEYHYPDTEAPKVRFGHHYSDARYVHFTMPEDGS